MYKIMNEHGLATCGVAQFEYKGVTISMSTIGRGKGSNHSPVCVFSQNVNVHRAIGEFHTVEDAIKWIDGVPTLDYLGRESLAYSTISAKS